MYIPAAFGMKDRDEMTAFVRQHSFALLCSQGTERLFATHLPLLLLEDEAGHQVLRGHVARANPHWRELDGANVMAVFQGPHAYISPAWYVEPQAVPTWNYVAVHVYGTCRILTDEQALHLALRQMVEFYEPTSTLLQHLDETFYTNMARGVVGFEIEVTAMEGKAKLSQNKSEETVQGVIDALRRSTDGDAHAVARLMEAALDRA